nr:nucleoid-associated protein [Dyella sp. ASV21]
MVEGYVPITSVRHVIVHTLKKEQKDATGAIDPRQEEMEVSELAQRLVDTLYVEYRKRHSKSHGKFDGDEEKSPSQVYARHYLIDKEIAFYEFSTAMAKLLCDKTARTAATGGHIFIAHVDHDSVEYVLIALITEEQAIALSAGKNLRPAEYLNLKGFRFAGRIDATAWNAGAERYVSFLKGTKNVADYFKAFLACDTAISNLLDTQHLTESMRRFVLSVEVEGSPLTEAQRDSLLRKVDAECRRMADDSIPLNITEFSRAMWPSDPDAFADSITQSGFEINDGFVPHKSGLRGLVSFRGKSAHWTLEFDRRALLSKDIVYNDSDRSITLKGLPLDLIEKLREEDEDSGE